MKYDIIEFCNEFLQVSKLFSKKMVSGKLFDVFERDDGYVCSGECDLELNESSKKIAKKKFKKYEFDFFDAFYLNVLENKELIQIESTDFSKKEYYFINKRSVKVPISDLITIFQRNSHMDGTEFITKIFNGTSHPHYNENVTINIALNQMEQLCYYILYNFQKISVWVEFRKKDVNDINILETKKNLNIEINDLMMKISEKNYLQFNSDLHHLSECVLDDFINSEFKQEFEEYKLNKTNKNIYLNDYKSFLCKKEVLKSDKIKCAVILDAIENNKNKFSTSHVDQAKQIENLDKFEKIQFEYELFENVNGLIHIINQLDLYKKLEKNSEN